MCWRKRGIRKELSEKLSQNGSVRSSHVGCLQSLHLLRTCLVMLVDSIGDKSA